MSSYYDLFPSAFYPNNRAFFSGNVRRGAGGKSKELNHSIASSVNVYDESLAYNDNGKSYVSNWEIYSQIPYFDIDEWLESNDV